MKNKKIILILVMTLCLFSVRVLSLDLPRFDAMKKSADEYLVREKFKELPYAYDKFLPFNKGKDRSSYALPYDNIYRVTLSNGEYINASHIRLSRRHRYIATQSPLESTLPEFWQMIFEYRCEDIVTLGNDESDKMYPYWEKIEDVNFFGAKVRRMSEYRPSENLIIRKFEIQNQHNEFCRDITQYHYIKWPDGDIPGNERDFLLLMRLLSYPKNVPTVVHCSAGIGRTGVFCAANIIWDLIVDKQFKNVKSIVEDLRKCRMGMVYSYCQYEFLEAFSRKIQEIRFT